jgi:hypothetical protein
MYRGIVSWSHQWNKKLFDAISLNKSLPDNKEKREGGEVRKENRREQTEPMEGRKEGEMNLKRTIKLISTFVWSKDLVTSI